MTNKERFLRVLINEIKREYLIQANEASFNLFGNDYCLIVLKDNFGKKIYSCNLALCSLSETLFLENIKVGYKEIKKAIKSISLNISTDETGITRLMGRDYIIIDDNIRKYNKRLEWQYKERSDQILQSLIDFNISKNFTFGKNRKWVILKICTYKNEFLCANETDKRIKKTFTIEDILSRIN